MTWALLGRLFLRSFDSGKEYGGTSTNGRLVIRVVVIIGVVGTTGGMDGINGKVQQNDGGTNKTTQGTRNSGNAVSNSN